MSSGYPLVSPPPLPSSSPPGIHRHSLSGSSNQPRPHGLSSSSMQHPLQSSSPSPPLQQECDVTTPIKLYTTREQRELCDHLADLYSLLATIEHVETAYVRDAIQQTKDYTSTCTRLIAQYKTLRETLGVDVPDLEAFCLESGLSCRAAITRLKAGIPATMLHGEVEESSQGMASLVFKTTQSYITVLDALKLGMRAVDQLVPLLNDIMTYSQQMPDMPADHEARQPVRHWLQLLNQLRAHDELSAEQSRQCEFDLQKAYDAVYRFLEEKDKRGKQRHNSISRQQQR